MKLWQKVILGLILGVIFGYCMNAGSPLQYDGKALLEAYLLPLGKAFIDLIYMVVVPLIFFSLVSGVTSMSDKDAFKRVGLKAVIAFLSTAAFAVIIGLVLGQLFSPGHGVDLSELAKLTGGKPPEKKEFTLATFLKDVIPNNVVGAMSTNDHILQVVVFAIFTAITINAVGEKGLIVKEFCQSAAQVIFKMIEGIMKLAPYGVFALIAYLVSSQGSKIIVSLAWLVLTTASALFLQYLLFGLMIIVFGRLSPLPFYRKILETQSFAFSTSSSKATLPTAMRVANERMGVSKTHTSFLLPLGASINMDGTAIYLGVCSLFIAQATGIPLTSGQYVTLILTSTLGSIGAAGIPGGSLLMMGMVFSSVGLPLSGIGVIAGIDRVLDMLRTTVNITGDTVITLLIDKSEGTFDEKTYYDKSL